MLAFAPRTVRPSLSAVFTYLEQKVDFGGGLPRAREGHGELAAAVSLRHHAGRGHVELRRVHGGARGVNQVNAVIDGVVAVLVRFDVVIGGGGVGDVVLLVQVARRMGPPAEYYFAHLERYNLRKYVDSLVLSTAAPGFI